MGASSKRERVKGENEGRGLKYFIHMYESRIMKPAIFFLKVRGGRKTKRGVNLIKVNCMQVMKISQ
jgi:hypothetical protein